MAVGRTSSDTPGASGPLDELALIYAFIDAAIEQKPLLLANPQMRIESGFNTLQLFAKGQGLVATSALNQSPPKISIKIKFGYWELMHRRLIEKSYVPIGSDRPEFFNYAYRLIPEGYDLNCTPATDLWKLWWQRTRGSRRRQLGMGMDLLVLTDGNWFPIRSVASSQGFIYVKTLGKEIMVAGSDMLIWLTRREDPGDGDHSSDPADDPSGGTPSRIRPGLRGYYRPGASRRRGIDRDLDDPKNPWRG